MSTWGHDFRYAASTPEHLRCGGLGSYDLCSYRTNLLSFLATAKHVRPLACRPDYRKIAAFRKSFPTVPCTALTATATGKVRDDITRSLHMASFPRGHRVFRASCFRSNLTLRICAKPANGNKADEVLVLYLKSHLAQHTSGAVIVYCQSRRECGELAQMLEQNGIRAVVYNAGLAPKKRREAQAVWQNGAPAPSMRGASYHVWCHVSPTATP